MALYLPPAIADAVMRRDLYILNRPNPTQRRGKIDIFAWSKIDGYERELHLLSIFGVNSQDIPDGLAGSVTVLDCLQPHWPECKELGIQDEPFLLGPWCWILDNAKRHQPQQNIRIPRRKACALQRG